MNRATFSAKTLSFSALFAALCMLGTLFIIVPLPNGYVNIGDVFVLLSGWLLGPIYGTIAAAVGSALADLVSGFSLYAPVTFFVKGLVAVLAWLLYQTLQKVSTKTIWSIASRALAALIAETCMVLGYFLFESVLYGFAGGALALVGNSLQGIACATLATLVAGTLSRIERIRTWFPLY